MNPSAVVDWNNYLQELCEWVLQNLSQIARKMSKCRINRKFFFQDENMIKVGRIQSTKQWVFWGQKTSLVRTRVEHPTTPPPISELFIKIS